MQEAVSVEIDNIIEHTTPSSNEDEATYQFSTMIDASENPLSSEEINEIIQESERTGKSFAFIAQQKLKDRAKIKTIVSPANSIPNITPRTKHKR